MPLRLPLFLLFVALYGYELSRRRMIWAILCPEGGDGTCCRGSGQTFRARVQALRDAEPCVDLCVAGEPPVAYHIAEWRDETQAAESDSFEGVPSGLHLVTFPVIILPGDDAEASALEHARQECALSSGRPAAAKTFQESTARDQPFPGGVSCEAAGIRAAVRFLDGTQTNTPEPHILVEGVEACCARCLLILSVPLLFGLVADNLMRLCLSHLEWPVRKRFFTISGSNLGKLLFLLDGQGDVSLEGDEAQLRQANHFWCKDADWEAMWAETEWLSEQLTYIRRIRITCCCSSGLAVVLSFLVSIWLANSGNTVVGGKVLGFGLLLSVALFLVAGCAGFMEHNRAESCAGHIGKNFVGTAVCRASWNESWSSSHLVAILVEQLPPPKRLKTAIA